MERENEIIFNKRKKLHKGNKAGGGELAFRSMTAPDEDVKRKIHIVGGEWRANLMSFSRTERKKRSEDRK
jgi:hypothetical protein